MTIKKNIADNSDKYDTENAEHHQTKNKDTGDIEEYTDKINNTRQRKPVDNLSK